MVLSLKVFYEVNIVGEIFPEVEGDTKHISFPKRKNSEYEPKEMFDYEARDKVLTNLENNYKVVIFMLFWKLL